VRQAAMQCHCASRDKTRWLSKIKKGATAIDPKRPPVNDRIRRFRVGGHE